jgi:O-antigen/teichoic acid export membrane protein
VTTNRGRPLLVAIMSATGAGQAAVGAATALIATLVLGPAGRGTMVIGLTVCGLISVVCGLATGSGLRSLLPGATAAQRHGLLAGYVSCSALAVAASGVLAVGAVAVSAPLVDPDLAEPGFLVGTAAAACAATVLQQSTDLWFADGRFRRGSTGALLLTAGGLVGLLLGIAVERSAAALLIGQASGTLVVCAWQLRTLARAGLLVVARPERDELLALVRRGFPALGLTGGLAVALRGDRYILGLVAGPAAVGIYSVAATLGEAARNIPLAAGQLFLRDAALGSGPRELTRSCWTAVVGAAAAGGIVLAVSIPLVAPVLGPEFAGVPALLVVLVVAEVCFAPFFVTSRGLVGAGWTTAAGVLGAVGGLISIGAYLVAVGAFAAEGMAIASLVVYAGLSATTYVLLRTRLRPRSLVRDDHA